MPHRSHLKQQNKRFKKVKRTKNKVRNRKIEKSGKRKEIKRVKDILNERHHSCREKLKRIKLEKQEKAKHIPFYETLNICILSFHEEVDVLSFKRDFIKYLYLENEDDIDTETIQLYDIYTIHLNEKKENRMLTIYDIPRTVYGIIDGTKSADIILCLFKDASLEKSCFDETGYELLSVLKAQGVPSVIGVSYKNESTNIKQSQKFVLRYFISEFTEKDKLCYINEAKDFNKLYNEIWNTKIRNLCYRDGRGYMLVDSCAYNCENNCIYLKGFIKGVGLNTENPIHITNVGDYYVDDIFVLDIKINAQNNNNDTSLKMKKKEKEYFKSKKISQRREQKYTYAYAYANDNVNNDNVNNNNVNVTSTNLYTHKDSLLSFLNQHKSSSTNFDICYHPMHVQSRKKEQTVENENDDFSCIRPFFMMNYNEENQCTNLMTLKNKEEQNMWKLSKEKYSDNSSERESERERETDNESDLENVTNKYRKEMSNDMINEKQANPLFKYKPNFSLSQLERENGIDRFTYKPKVEMNREDLYVEKKDVTHRWAYMSEEKREYNEDVVCSFDKKEGIENKIPTQNIFYNGFEKSVFKKESFYEIEDKDKNKSKPNEMYKHDSDEESFSDKSENDTSDESEKEKEENPSNKRNGTELPNAQGKDEAFELDSVRSDQIYLHHDISAKERFKKYRSLASFINTHIDVYEDLPVAYSRIYDYESYQNLKKYSQKKYAHDCNFINNKFSLTNTYCVVVISNENTNESNIDDTLRTKIQNKPKEIPLIISSVLPFERKVTVLNMKVKKNPACEEKVKSKENLEIICGFRHFMSRPIFSEEYIKAIQSRGLYERHLKEGENKVASIYGFTTVTRSPVFLLKEKDTSAVADVDRNNNIQGTGDMETHSSQNALNQHLLSQSRVNNTNENSSLFLNNGMNQIMSNTISAFENDSVPPASQKFLRLLNPVVVATGKVMNCDCKRIVMKRISITGRPYKIHKKKVVVRGMFHNPKDINYFKPVELQTRLGLSGKITESLGMHGKMKCVFSNVLKAHDVIFMNLYKRVFPKWYPLSWNDSRNFNPDENVPDKNTYVATILQQ